MRTTRWLLATLAMLTAGCTSVQYSRTWGTYKVQDEERPKTDPQIRFDTTTHMVSTWDTSGVFCASLFTNLDAAAARKEAIDDAEPFQDTITYNYRVHSAQEYAGMRCGTYFRWTDTGEGFDYAVPIDLAYPSGSYGSTNSFAEGGLVLEEGMAVDAGVAFSVMARLGLAGFEVVLDEAEKADLNGLSFSSTFLEFSLGLRFDFAPPILFGLGVHPFYYFNFVSLASAYGADLGYTFAFSDSFAIEAGGRFEEREFLDWQASKNQLLAREWSGYGRLAYLW